MDVLKSFLEIQTEVLTEGEALGDPQITTQVKAWINEIAQELCYKYDFPELKSRWYAPLTTVAPTPLVWEPYALIQVPRDIIRLYENDCFLVDTTQAQNQPKYPLEVMSDIDFAQYITVSNTTSTGTPSRICLRRREGAREDAFDPRAIANANTGIAVFSSVTEASPPTLQVTYYTDVNRINVKQVVYSGTVDATTRTITTDVHYGIKSVSKAGSSTGLWTIRNNVSPETDYCTIYPWERAASFPVLAFDQVPASPIPNSTLSYLQVHITYKRAPEYAQVDSDTLQPMPADAQKVVIAYALARTLKIRKGDEWRSQWELAHEMEVKMMRRIRLYENERRSMELG